MAAQNTIAVDAGSDTKYIEGIALETILPGQLLYWDVTDPARRLDRFEAGADGDKMPMMIAVENQAQGKTVEDSYLVNERVYMRHFRAGDLFLARVVEIATFVKGQGMGFTIAGAAARPGEFIATTVENSEAVCMEEIETTAAGQLVLLAAN